MNIQKYSSKKLALITTGDDTPLSVAVCRMLLKYIYNYFYTPIIHFPCKYFTFTNAQNQLVAKYSILFVVTSIDKKEYRATN